GRWRSRRSQSGVAASRFQELCESDAERQMGQAEKRDMVDAPRLHAKAQERGSDLRDGPIYARASEFACGLGGGRMVKRNMQRRAAWRQPAVEKSVQRMDPSSDSRSLGICISLEGIIPCTDPATA